MPSVPQSALCATANRVRAVPSRSVNAGDLPHSGCSKTLISCPRCCGGCSARSRYPCVALRTFDGFVAATRRRFETFLIENRDIAAAVTDQFTPLQRTGSLCYADPPHAQHVGKKFLCQTKPVCAYAIARHKQPAGKASFDHVKTVARGGLRDLDHQYMDIAVQRLLQWRGLTECFTKTH